MSEYNGSLLSGEGRLQDVITTQPTQQSTKTTSLQNQPQDSFKVYKERFAILLAITIIAVTNGFSKAVLSVLDVFMLQLDIGMNEYRVISQLPNIITIFSVIPLSKAVDHFGLRKMAHIYCLLMIISGILKALTCFHDENSMIYVIKEQRFLVYVIGESLYGVSFALTIAFPAKVGYDWFPLEETTRAIIVGTIGQTLSIGIVNYVIPKYVKTTSDYYIIGYLFVISSIILTLSILLLVRNSLPPTPPSQRAIMTAENKVPLKHGLFVIMTDIQFILVLLTYVLNLCLMASIQTVLEDIMKKSGYSNEFCGSILGQSAIFAIIFGVGNAYLVDWAGNYIRISKIASVICALALSGFCISLNFKSINALIIFTNMLTSFGTSLFMAGITQTIFKSGSGLVKECTVSALMTLLTMVLTIILIHIQSPLILVADNFGFSDYSVILAVYSFVIIGCNLLFVIFFEEPNRDKLLARLRLRMSDILLANESHPSYTEPSQSNS